jgi:hypothetical protein
MLRTCLAVVLAASGALAQAPKAAYVVEYREKPSIQAVLEYRVTCPNATATEWVVAVPVAPELPAQKRVKTGFNLSDKVVNEKSDAARSVIVAQVPVKTAAGKTSVAIEVTYEATLYGRELRPLKPGETRPKVPPLADAERKLSLAATTDLDFNSAKFRKWLASASLQREDKENEVEFARRAFESIRSQGKYEYLGAMDRKASSVCETLKTDCGGFAQLFAASLRANGIPARCLFGRWAESAKPDAKLGKIAYFQWHVIAEFHADGVGWIPADVSSAIVHERPGTPSRHFGNQPGTFLTQHIDANLRIDSIHFGIAELQNLQQPSWWVRGTGKVDGATQAEGWKVALKR